MGSRRRAGGRRHPVAEVGEEIAGRLPELPVVVDQEDALAPGTDLVPGLRPRLPAALGLVAPRQAFFNCTKLNYETE